MLHFGGGTALFSTVGSQRNFRVNQGRGQPDGVRFTRLLLGRGLARPGALLRVVDDFLEQEASR